MAGTCPEAEPKIFGFETFRGTIFQALFGMQNMEVLLGDSWLCCYAIIMGI